ncbi:MAG: polysaccharide pyruvyl transferase family protein [Chloroflexota bacterium]
MIPFPVRLPARPTLVVGGYGYRNAGDEAMLAGMLRLLGRDGITVVSRAPAETAAVHDVRSIGLAAAPRAMLAHPGVVIGGGGLFGRDMGALGRLLPLFGLLVAATGRDVALLGIGVDRDMPASSARLLAMLGARATSVAVRDAESRAILASLGVDARLQPDLSSLVPSAGRDAGVGRLRSIGLDPDRRPVVGLCLTAVDPALADRLHAAVLAAIDALPGVDFCLVPLSRHPFVAAHNDEIAARRLAAERPRLRVLVPPDDPAELLAVFEAFAAAVCMRYHSLLFADRAGIPIVPIPYAEKCLHWLAEHGLVAADPSPSSMLAGLGAALGEAIA